MATAVPARLTRNHLRRFGLTLGGAFGALAMFLLWKGAAFAATVLGSVGGLLALAGLAVPELLRPVERQWMRFAHALSRITTPVFMGVLYFLVITPIGWIRRATGRRPMVHGEPGQSAWVTREATRRRSDLRHQF